MPEQAAHATTEAAQTPGSPAGTALLTGPRRRMLAATFAAAFIMMVAGYVLPASMSVMVILLAAGTVLILWRPELSFSAMVAGAGFLDSHVREAQLRHSVALVIAFFAVAMAAVIIRRALRIRGWDRVRTPLDWPVALITGYALVSLLLGLLRGHDPSLVIFSSWHVLNWPLFYLITTTVVNTPDRLGVNAAYSAFEGLLGLPAGLLTTAETGGSLSRFAPVVLALLLMRRPPIPRGWLILALGVSLLDVIQASFRSKWLSTALALGFVAVLGIRRIRSHRVLMATIIGVTFALAGVLAIATLLRDTPLGMGVQESMTRSAGHRFDEAYYGWQAFTEAPIFGKGFGYRNKQAWIPGLDAYGAGPVYHMFHLIILAAQGLVGMALALWMLSKALVGRGPRWLRARLLDDPWAAVGVGLQGSVVAAFVSAAFAGPRIGHNEWAFRPALVLLCARWAKQGPLAPSEARSPDRSS